MKVFFKLTSTFPFWPRFRCCFPGLRTKDTVRCVLTRSKAAMVSCQENHVKTLNNTLFTRTPLPCNDPSVYSQASLVLKAVGSKKKRRATKTTNAFYSPWVFRHLLRTTSFAWLTPIARSDAGRKYFLGIKYESCSRLESLKSYQMLKLKYWVDKVEEGGQDKLERMGPKQGYICWKYFGCEVTNIDKDWDNFFWQLHSSRKF